MVAPNLLFIQLDPNRLGETKPFVTAYDLDYKPGTRQWRADADGVKFSANPAQELTGVWSYLYKGVWQRLTAQEAYELFPELEERILVDSMDEGELVW